MNLLVTSYLSISSVILLSKLDINTANAILCQKLKKYFCLQCMIIVIMIFLSILPNLDFTLYLCLWDTE